MRSIRVTTVIAAPVEFVWAELVALSDYPAWNPFITSIRGDLVAGARLEVRIAPPGGRTMTFRPTVIAVEHGARVEWLGHVGFTGVFDGRHSFEVEPTVDGGTRLTQAEEFSGLLVPLMGAVLPRTRAGFEAMNEALRVRAERSAASDTLG